MNYQKPTFLLVILLVSTIACYKQKQKEAESPDEILSAESHHQTRENRELFDILKSKDSLLFELGYNQCDSAIIKELTGEDFEFYHDQSGMTRSKPSFVESMKGLCRLSYKPRRELVEGSLSVFPLYNNGNLYGAIQMGEHRFYALEENKPEYLTSTAKFTSLWLKDNERWTMSRVLSYDHQIPE